MYNVCCLKPSDVLENLKQNFVSNNTFMQTIII